MHAHTGIETVKISKMSCLLYSNDKYFKVFAVYNVLTEAARKTEATKRLIICLSVSMQCRQKA